MLKKIMSFFSRIFGLKKKEKETETETEESNISTECRVIECDIIEIEEIEDNLEETEENFII